MNDIQEIKNKKRPLQIAFKWSRCNWRTRKKCV